MRQEGIYRCVGKICLVSAGFRWLGLIIIVFSFCAVVISKERVRGEKHKLN